MPSSSTLSRRRPFPWTAIGVYRGGSLESPHTIGALIIRIGVPLKGSARVPIRDTKRVP